MGLLNWIPWRFRPVMRLGVRICLDRLAEGGIEGLPELTDEQREGIDRVRSGYFFTVLSEAQSRFAAMPKAMKAVGEGERPFIDWIFKEGGWQVIYAIVQMILMAFGIVLPPLPPIPPKPPVTMAKKGVTPKKATGPPGLG